MSKTPTVREATSEDFDTVREIVAAAYGGEQTAGLFDGLRDSTAWLDVAFVAEDKDRIVAAACFTRAWLDAPTKIFEVLVLSPGGGAARQAARRHRDAAGPGEPAAAR